MITYVLAIVVGLVAASIITGGVFRMHDEWRWMKPKKVCIKCEQPKNVLDLLPVVGNLLTRFRCRKCKAYVQWQYPVIELVILLLVVFHFWRYMNGIWVPAGYLDMVEIWLARDIIFTLLLVIIFVYDLKYSLILDKYSLPGIVIALVLNMILGVNGFVLASGMLVLFLFFLAQYALSGGRILGGGDVRMGVLMGAMLGFAGGVGAVLLSYMVGAVYGIIAIASGKSTLKDRVPFGTFLSIGAFIMLVWGSEILSLFL